MQPDEFERYKEKMGGLKQHFEKLESGFSVKEDLDFDRDREASFWFEPKGGGRSLLVRLDLATLLDYEVSRIIRLMEKCGWQSLLRQIPEGHYLRLRESGPSLVPSFCEL